MFSNPSGNVLVASMLVVTEYSVPVIKMCEFLRLDFNINVVALSGGVFQNNFILNNTYNELKKKNFKVLTHKDIPTNDGGISIGQLVIAKNNF